jgi:hypothetical protein
MTRAAFPAEHRRDYPRAADRLSEMVRSVEFTMISVIAGLLLFPLIESATPLVRGLRFEFWVYILTQISIVMFFWTALISHTMTFICWPIDIGHNLLYLVLFPTVGIEMHFMDDPRAFYPMLAVITFQGFVLTAYDLSLIRRRLKAARGAAAELFAAVHSRQRTLVQLCFAGFLITIAMAAVVSAFADLFVVRHLHVLLGMGVLAYILFLVHREFRKLNGMRDKVLDKFAEEIALSNGGTGAESVHLRA